MDPIADMLIRIKNAQKAGHDKVEIPFSRIKFELVKILQKEGILDKVERKGIRAKERLELTLKSEQNVPVIQDLRRVSKPGRRVYLPAGKIRPVKQGYGLAIISTSRGLMTGKEARKNKLGGEVICEVW